MNLSCYCGAVEIEFQDSPDSPDSLTSCNCSVCNRYGALWGYFKPNEVKISCDSAAFGKYTWGDEYLSFCHCKKCGCVTHYETLEKAESPVIALNFKTQ